MQIVHGDSRQGGAGLQWRQGDTTQDDLLNGAADGIDNYLLSYGVLGDFFSPRHRHNFEQIRVQIDGELDFGRDGKLTAGMFGYFPEGLRYGPQNSSRENGPNVTLVMQCGGASESGYISPSTVKRAYDELSGYGSFDGGVFRPNDPVTAGGKKNKDAFQALWEHVSGREMVYPDPRYGFVIMADPEHFHWIPVPGQAGAAVKPMGSFTERQTRMGLIRIEAGATFRPDAERRDVLFVLDGTGQIEGQEIRRQTAIEIGYGETPAIEASETLTMILFGLPDMRDQAAVPTRERSLQAA